MSSLVQLPGSSFSPLQSVDPAITLVEPKSATMVNTTANNIQDFLYGMIFLL